MDYNPRSRGVSRLYAHLVLTPKYRRRVITQEMLERLGELVEELCVKWRCELLEFNGEADHVHILFRFYPQVQLSKFIGNLKSVTSRRLRAEFPEYLEPVYPGRSAFWTESYSVDSCGDAPLDVLKRYVKSQAGCQPPSDSG